jgi:hypothetical protein
MDTLNKILLILHFLGLAMGLSASFGNMVMAGLIAKAAPGEKPVLGRFPPAISRVGSSGLALLWITGLSLLFTRWGGFANLPNMPWQFHLKLTLVVILSGLVGYMQTLLRRMQKGDAAAAATLPIVGRVAFVLVLTIVTCAVFAFSGF